MTSSRCWPNPASERNEALNLDWTRLLPKTDLDYPGPRGPVYFLGLIAVISTVRSLIHLFAPDGGAQSIAGLAVDGVGGANLIALFGQWGGLQLLLAAGYWVVLYRYRFLVPAMLLMVVLELWLRLGAGQLKPLVVAAPPPGAIGSEWLWPIALVVFLWSLRRPAGLT